MEILWFYKSKNPPINPLQSGNNRYTNNVNKLIFEKSGKLLTNVRILILTSYNV